MAAADFRDKLLAGLGGDWPAATDLKARVEKVEPKDGYRLETVSSRTPQIICRDKSCRR
jgi:hypothetical protein